ncbi:MAG: hydroxymethylbilane synthase [Hyphomicrobiales bacterium]|nr:hydroxymethylbilane synthase [Hyphomicrobiales bacterium]
MTAAGRDASLMRLGTRGSPLALAQAHETQRLVAAAQGAPAASIAIEVIRTSGDMILDRTLAAAGGKGLFTRELDEALLRGDIDLGVHSAKDLPTLLPDGIILAGTLPREDVRDAFISFKASDIMALPKGARVGTASLRRAAQVKRLRPDLVTGLLRGNVGTRLKKVEEGVFDATLLALAGLNRLHLAHHATSLLPLAQFLPACGQGAVAITIRAGDSRIMALLAPVLHQPTLAALLAERAFLRALDGSCRTPIAGLATIEGTSLRFTGQVLALDGRQVFEAATHGAVADAAALGKAAADDILRHMPADFLKA